MDKNLGRTFKTSHGNTLTIISHNEMNGNKKKYYFHCDVCSLDEQLFGPQSIAAPIYNLERGQVPCGCSKNHRWTTEQYIIKVGRILEDNGSSLYNTPDKIQATTPLTIHCGKCSNKYRTNFNKLERTYKQSNGRLFCCKHCDAISTGNRSRKEDATIFTELFEAANLPLGGILCRSDRTNFFKYKCPVCSNDEYTKSGLCTGVFEVFNGTLKAGGKPCRCSSGYKSTSEQKLFKIKNFLKESDRPIGNISLISRKRVKCECLLHGDFEISTGDLLSGKWCKICGFSSQPSNHFYINQVIGTSMIKYGVAVNPEKRLKIQNYRNKLKMETLYIFKFSDVESCMRFEQEIHNLYSEKLVNKIDMVDGFTETTSIQHLENILNKLRTSSAIQIFKRA